MIEGYIIYHYRARKLNTLRLIDEIETTTRSILDGLIKSNGEICSINESFDWVQSKLNATLNYEGIKLEVSMQKNLIYYILHGKLIYLKKTLNGQLNLLMKK